jgi:RNA polymerase primary sigma factor
MKGKSSVDDFLTEMGRFKLLCHEEEITLARKVQKKNKILSMLEEKVSSNITKEKSVKFLSGRLKEKNLSVSSGKILKDIALDFGYSSISSLPKAYQSGLKARRTMVECNLRLVVSIAKKHLDRGIPFHDLIQDGTIGLQKAVDKFNPERGFRFSTMAYMWIKQEITRSIQNQSKTIRLPVHFWSTLNKIKKAQSELSQELLRKPTNIEVAQRLNMKVEEYREILQHPQCNLSLNVTGGDEENLELLLIIPSEDQTPLQKLELKNELDFLLRFLTKKEKDILIRKYGLYGTTPASIEAIGHHYKVTKQRIRMIEREALKKARKALITQ